jgi:hypothetical protein
VSLFSISWVLNDSVLGQLVQESRYDNNYVSVTIQRNISYAALTTNLAGESGTVFYRKSFKDVNSAQGIILFLSREHASTSHY